MEYPELPYTNGDLYARLPSRTSSHRSTNSHGHLTRRSRIVKPTSRNVSPRNNNRKHFNQLSDVPLRTRSMVDRRPTYSTWQPSLESSTGRPLSWHVPHDGRPAEVQPQTSTYINSYNNLSVPYHRGEVNDIYTPLSMPPIDEPQIHDSITPLDEYPINVFEQGYPYWSFPMPPQNHFWPQELKPVEPHAPIYDPHYQQFQTTSVNTAPASPTFLPIQSYATDRDERAISAPVDEEVLVGVGLYDKPESVRASGLLSSTFDRRGSLGKGLRLEDALEPPLVINNDDDELGTDVDDEEEEEDCEEEEQANDLDLPQMTDSNAVNLNLSGQSFYHDQEKAYSSAQQNLTYPQPLPFDPRPIQTNTHYPYMYNGLYEWY